ncbi:hypothetical protein FQA47_013198 [Oryzias melastigma]|uniref:Uncharacterized protein n=1 Tax=Oryzias melastigma TaxID=30732 RepID=A0A834FHD2_ORYME|nr:hypothetical protein FQA47_013198 [Oryzias melastigma]
MRINLRRGPLTSAPIHAVMKRRNLQDQALQSGRPNPNCAAVQNWNHEGGASGSTHRCCSSPSDSCDFWFHGGGNDLQPGENLWTAVLLTQHHSEAETNQRSPERRASTPGRFSLTWTPWRSQGLSQSFVVCQIACPGGAVSVAVTRLMRIMSETRSRHATGNQITARGSGSVLQRPARRPSPNDPRLFHQEGFQVS